jgi:cell division protein FtsL
MAYKSIKKGKGKRKGGKKSNRTYKQNGGNKMLLMIIAMLVALGLIFPVSAKLFTNSEEQSNRIVNAVENKLTDTRTEANDYKLGLSSGMIISVSGSIIGQIKRKDNLNQEVNELLRLIEKIYGDDFLVLTEGFLCHLISKNLGEDSLTHHSTLGTNVIIPKEERTSFDTVFGFNKRTSLSDVVGTGSQYVPGAGENVYILSQETLIAMENIGGIRGKINELLENLFKDGSTIEVKDGSTIVDPNYNKFGPIR